MTKFYVAIFLTLCASGLNAGEKEAKEILDATGVTGGLIVHAGCGDGRLTAALRTGNQYLVHGLDSDLANVAAAREHVRSLGLYGKISIDTFDGKRLPYADNSVNLVLAEAESLPDAEAMRVICPGGVLHRKKGGKWSKIVKPWPNEIDTWTHSLYDASGNAIGSDTQVAPPRQVQWVGGPRRARQHERTASISVVVSSAGRIFSIQDEGSIESVILPPKWFLVGRDAFNGVELWRLPIGPWEDHLRGFRNGPPELSRRLVAVDDTVYVTLGYGEPVTALDAATGKTLRVYDKTEDASEIVYSDGVLYVIVDSLDLQQKETAKRRKLNVPPASRRMLAIDAKTGKTLWEKSDGDAAGVMPTTLAVARDCVYFQSLENVVCLDAKSGKEVWRAKRPVSPRRPDWSAPTLVVYEDIVFSADRAMPKQVDKTPGRKHKSGWIDSPTGELIALSAETGKELWRCECRESFHAAVDVLVADGLVWTGELAHAVDAGITVGRDPKTGKIKRRRPIDKEFFTVGMPHHRCYRNRGTNDYLVLGRAGVEFIDLASGDGIPHHWIRGTCQYGIVPCNGLLYVPPHSCACYTKAKLNGFYAMTGSPMGKVTGEPLQRGPAFGKVKQPSKSDAADWPTYRHDAARSGATQAKVSKDLEPAWETEIGGKLSGVTVAGGKVFVAAIDEHAICALDAADGKLLWRFVAGGRVDSPPTIYRGMALFGCTDGWVYCLRAADGKLVWRRLAAPKDNRIVSYGQLESLWPVHGSVLIDDGAAYVAAGRCSYLDGGIRFLKLNPETGELLLETTIDTRDAKLRQPKGSVKSFDLPGAIPDVLSTDGDLIFMRHLALDRKGIVQPNAPPHLFCPTGLLDDSWWHRSYWIVGTSFYTGYRDWFRAGREVPGGRMLVVDGDSVFGFGRKPEYYNWSTPQKYHLFAADKKAKVIPSPKKVSRLPKWGQHEIEYRWSKEIPFRVRAMLLAGDSLVAAGPPEVDEVNAYQPKAKTPPKVDLAAGEATLKGKRGAMLWAFSTSDGTATAKRELAVPPVWDGLAAAEGRLFIATTDGKVICLK